MEQLQQPNKFQVDAGVFDFPALETYLAMYGPYVKLSVFCKADEQVYVVQLWGKDRSEPSVPKGYLICEGRSDNLHAALREVDIRLMGQAGAAINRFLTEQQAQQA